MNPEERAVLVSDIAAAIKALPAALSDEEQRWVRLAIKKEAQAIVFRTAVIEKSLLGVIAMMGAGVIYILAEFFRNHGFK
jgi:hypothetical protein